MDRYVLDKMHSSIKVSYFLTGIMIIYKIFIIILGLFLSYETWKFTFEEINDSRFAALSIFNTSVKKLFFNWKIFIIIIWIAFFSKALSIIATPVLFIIEKEIDAAFVFLSSFILICSLFSIVIIFYPKVC
jgi:hypothetical protein